MNLRSPVTRNVLRPLWEFSARHVLWQVHAGSDLFLVGEDRNLEKKEVSFFCLNARDGSILWRDVALDESWWVGVEALHEDWVIFHRFASPDMPGHRGVTVASLRSGKLLWSRADVRYRSCSGITLFAALDGPEGERLLELDIRDGRTMQSGAASPSARGRLPAITLPRYVFAESAEPGLREPVARELGLPPVFPLQVVERARHRAVLAHHQNVPRGDGAPDLAAHLLVFRQADDAVVYREVVNARVSAPTVQSMFALEDILVYSRQRSILSAFPL